MKQFYILSIFFSMALAALASPVKNATSGKEICRSDNLPYDAKVLWLESDGKQRIITPYIPAGIDIIRCKYIAYGTGNTTGLFSSDFGAWDANPNYWLMVNYRRAEDAAACLVDCSPDDWRVDDACRPSPRGRRRVLRSVGLLTVCSSRSALPTSLNDFSEYIVSFLSSLVNPARFLCRTKDSASSSGVIIVKFYTWFQVWTFKPYQTIEPNIGAMLNTKSELEMNLSAKYVAVSNSNINFKKQISVGKEHESQPPLTLFGRIRLRIYEFSAERNGKKIISLTPVVREGRGYMFDEVSNVLLGNAGTGDFIIGPIVE